MLCGLELSQPNDPVVIRLRLQVREKKPMEGQQRSKAQPTLLQRLCSPTPSFKDHYAPPHPGRLPSHSSSSFAQRRSACPAWPRRRRRRRHAAVDRTTRPFPVAGACLRAVATRAGTTCCADGGRWARSAGASDVAFAASRDCASVVSPGWRLGPAGRSAEREQDCHGRDRSDDSHCDRRRAVD